VRHGGDWLTHGQGNEELGHSNENALRGRAKENCAALQVPQRFCKLREGLQVLEAYKTQPEPWNEIIRRAVKVGEAESRAIFSILHAVTYQYPSFASCVVTAGRPGVVRRWRLSPEEPIFEAIDPVRGVRDFAVVQAHRSCVGIWRLTVDQARAMLLSSQCTQAPRSLFVLSLPDDLLACDVFLAICSRILAALSGSHRAILSGSSVRGDKSSKDPA
jgi:hypothetical protein